MYKYINEDINNPKYLFHGTSKLLEIIEQRQAHDSTGNIENEDYAVFLTSSFIIASAYAFMDGIKEDSKNLNWNFDIGYDPDKQKEKIVFENVNVDKSITGYIYVFPYNSMYEHHGRSIQYKCHENLKPIDVIKIKLSDFIDYYEIHNEIKKIK